MKKLISVLMLLLLILSAVGCGDKGTKEPEEAAIGFISAVYEQRADDAAEYLYQGTKDIMAGKENASNREVASKLEEVIKDSETAELKDVTVSGIEIIDKKDEIEGGIKELYAASGVSLDKEAVDAVATVEVKISASIDQTLENIPVPVYCAKIDGEWFVVYF